MDNASTTLYVHVRTPGTVPSTDGLHIVVETTLGARLDAGSVGP